MTTGRWPWVLAFVAICACKQAERNCEKARDAYARIVERQVKAAFAAIESEVIPPEQRARLTAEAKREHEFLRDGFVQVCLEVPESDRHCIERFEKLDEADEVLHRANRVGLGRTFDAERACRKYGSELPEAACPDESKAALDRELAGCKPALEAMLKRLWSRYEGAGAPAQ